MALSENFQSFIESVQDTTSDIHPFYKRTFREFIKFIPVVGSFIDAHTMGAIEDSILEERLSNLEVACEKALSITDSNSLQVELQNINNILLVLTFSGFADLLEQNKSISHRLDVLLAEARNRPLSFTPNADFLLVTISGASSAGKDCILDLLLSQADRTKRRLVTWTKFTTRKKRIVDSKYYNFVFPEDFERLMGSGNVMFNYIKRNAQYGFDKTDLFNSCREAQTMFSVHTHFESMPADRGFLRHLGIKHFAVLLTADKATLERRSEARLLDSADIEARRESIQKDFSFLKDNKDAIEKNFDLIIDNSDGSSKYETHNSIVQKIGIEELTF